MTNDEIRINDELRAAGQDARLTGRRDACRYGAECCVRAQVTAAGSP